jgi:hypothetical protein
VPHTRCTRFQPYHRFSERRAGSDLTLPWARGFYLTNTFERGEIGPDLFAAGCRMGMEGLVSKHRERAYRGGRCRHWIKGEEPQPCGVEPRVLTGGLFLGRCWQDDYQVGERVMAGVIMEHVPASLAEQQKHLFRWAVASDSRIDRAAMFACEINCLIAGDGHPNPLPTR